MSRFKLRTRLYLRKYLADLCKTLPGRMMFGISQNFLEFAAPPRNSAPLSSNFCLYTTERDAGSDASSSKSPFCDFLFVLITFRCQQFIPPPANRRLLFYPTIANFISIHNTKEVEKKETSGNKSNTKGWWEKDQRRRRKAEQMGRKHSAGTEGLLPSYDTTLVVSLFLLQQTASIIPFFFFW